MMEKRAKLLIAAKGLAPSVRGSTFCNHWSYLYQAEPYLLDLLIKPSHSGYTMMGQLLGEALQAHGGQVALIYQKTLLAKASLGPHADFSLPLRHRGRVQLVLTLAETTIVVHHLTPGEYYRPHWHV